MNNFRMHYQNEINAGDLTACCYCWRPTGDGIDMLESQRNVGDLAIMLVPTV